ncbi:MAG: PAS domain S-box protein, partial [Burkholderiaceae bacterium]
MEILAYAPPVEAIIDLLLDAVCVVDRDGRFLFISAAGERIFGYAAAEMLGRPMLDFVHPDDRESTLQAAGRVQSGHLQFDFENRYLRKDGRPVHLMWSARRSEADGVRVAVARDVTERKRAERMQAALYAIAEAAYGAEDLPALFRQIHQIVARLVPAASFSVALREGEGEGNGDRLTFPYHASELHPNPGPPAGDVQALCANVIRTGAPLLLGPRPVADDARKAAAAPGRAPSWLLVPLPTHQGALGAMALRSRPDAPPYTARDKELLQFISTQVATAVERKRLHERL